MITTAPWWWALAACALLPWLGPWRGRDRLQNVLRSLLFVALSAALSQPFLRRDDAPATRVLILDQSESVSQSARNAALKQANRFGLAADRRHAHLVVFGKIDSAALDELKKAFATVTQVAGHRRSGDSPLADALTAAQTLIPRTGSGDVTIASDGMATRADDARAISALRQRGVTIHVVDLPVAATPPTPVALSPVDELRVGATARLTATVTARGGGSPGTVTLRQDDRVLASAPYSGAALAQVALQFEPQQAGFIEAELAVASSTSVDEHVLPVLLAVQPPRRILYLGDLQRNGARELGELLGPGFELTRVDPRDEAQVQASLEKHDLIVMDDLSAESLPQSLDAQLMGAVADEGLGLVMSGGKGSFGGGGWHERTVASMLPVELVQKEEKRDPSTTLVVVIDTSGSMGGVRVQLAKEVSRLAIRRLLPHDKVGIVEFYGAKRWAAPIQPASNAIELQRALNRMNAGGGTVILPALEEAFYGLQNVDTRYKHVLVLTDGGVESGNFESLLRRMSKEGINVSTVLTGGGYHSEFLVNLSNWGKGRFYNVPNRFNLPEILLKQPSTAKLPAYRPGSHTVRARGGPGWWGDIDTSTIPELAGYVETKPRRGGEVLLETVEGEHPVLATWRYGLGRVTTLATEPVGEGSRPWRDWPNYGKALARILERNAADTRDPFRFELRFDGDEMRIHAIRQRPRISPASDAQPAARLLASDGGDPQDLTFVARSPDQFVARAPAPSQGDSWRIETSSTTTPTRWRPLAANSPVADERQVSPMHSIDFVELARLTGGEQLALDDSWAAPAPAAQGKHLAPLSSWLFGLALALFFAEILWRRRPQG
ncbi:MAG: VWA domain-containing protein [Pirellulaceae bacterium]|jgi:hypothetical protein|nr:VWA domain-containing protein [Pirellulaceae bacterium]MDP7018802.1 VWA domain-containing protein [Pirellulaceae bacterium]